MNIDTGYYVWSDLKIISIEIDSESAVIAAPMSDVQLSAGSVYVDLLKQDIQASKVVRPVKIRVTGIAPDTSTLEGLLTSFNDVSALFTITSKSVISDSMCIVNVEIEQSPEMLNGARVVIELEQVIVDSESGGFSPLQMADKPVSGVRIQSLPTAGLSASVQSLYNTVTTKIGRLF
jgi:hypothetical protein